MKIILFTLSMFSLLTIAEANASSNARYHHPKNNPAIIYLDQHWTKAERDKFYFTPQGSYLIPYSWFLALDIPGTYRSFNNKRNITSYGYLVDEGYSAANPDRLPVGFAKEPVTNGEPWLGYSCAACHTNNVRYRGQTVRVDGAPTLSDFTAFNNGLIRALNYTLYRPSTFNRFAHKILGNANNPVNQAELRERVIEHTAWLKGFARRGKPTHAFGPGRVDAFGVIMNEVFGRDLGEPDNVRIPNAPVSYPFLWGTPQHDFVQWTGSAFNPFGRNVGEVLGTFGKVNLDIKSPDFGLTTARGWELFELERLVAKLAKPLWPQKLFGAIDRASAARGRVLYNQSRNNEESCADCHALPNNAGSYPMTPSAENFFGVSFVKTHMTPLNEIGTDPLTATNFALRKVKAGAATPLLPAVFNDPNNVPAPAMLSLLVGVAVRDSIAHAQPPFNAPEIAELIGYRQKAVGLPPYTPPNLLAYRARPLDGIWATAPYLHNGSVPNLYELLLPPKYRSTVFYTGNFEFDANKVGFKTRRCFNSFRFDTRLPGNRNSGHIYGTDLNATQRQDLLEFLKTL